MTELMRRLVKKHGHSIRIRPRDLRLQLGVRDAKVLADGHSHRRMPLKTFFLFALIRLGYLSMVLKQIDVLANNY